ncbi:MAG: hypothetical protein ACI4XM_06445 [Candidatus Coprovivens sp.]
MYNLCFNDGESLIKIFDPVNIKQGCVDKQIAVALTNKRLLFMAYLKNDPIDEMIPGKVIGVIKFKKVFFEVSLDSIEKIEIVNNNESYKVIIDNGTFFLFDNEDLYNYLVGTIKK